METNAERLPNPYYVSVTRWLIVPSCLHWCLFFSATCSYLSVKNRELQTKPKCLVLFVEKQVGRTHFQTDKQPQSHQVSIISPTKVLLSVSTQPFSTRTSSRGWVWRRNTFYKVQFEGTTSRQRTNKTCQPTEPIEELRFWSVVICFSTLRGVRHRIFGYVEAENKETKFKNVFFVKN